ncbi:Oxysterol-binding protein [Suillus subluteus]|nr:Oxysterol-binding protein [Suillus subluteus]
MIVRNHRTGNQCVLTFKPRGWRGKDAYEISDADGEVTHKVAGQWNSQLICRAVGTGSGFLHPDATVSGPSSPNYTTEYILLWCNSEKPTTPFNLTPFAITLNDCPDETLRPYLCPTDCRLRPDQRAFEMGKYELANGLKMQQEEQQQATQRAREEGHALPHRPRWFRAETDGDTGERVWAPSRAGDMLEYWVERERVQEKGGRQPWKDVEPIFIVDDV